MTNEDAYDIANELDAADIDVTPWESNFLDSVLKRQPRPLSSEQKRVLRDLEDKYLN